MVFEADLRRHDHHHVHHWRSSHFQRATEIRLVFYFLVCGDEITALRDISVGLYRKLFGGTSNDGNEVSFEIIPVFFNM